MEGKIGPDMPIVNEALCCKRDIPTPQITPPKEICLFNTDLKKRKMKYKKIVFPLKSCLILKYLSK